MRSTQDIAWLAGLLEGEGCFKVGRPARYPTKAYPRISVQMTDEDVVRRAADIMGARFNGPYERPGKTVWMANLQTRAEVAGWLMTLYPLMGARRQERIRELLAIWHDS